MSLDIIRCEECGGKFNGRPRKIVGKKGWCSHTCLVNAGIVPRPEPKPVSKSANSVPRQPGYQKQSRKSAGLGGAI